jgi:hypothetical protein
VHSSLHFGLDALLQKALARRLRKTSVSGSAKSSWLGELENVSVGPGVSLLQWRSRGFEHPHDTPGVSPQAATNFRA